MDEWMLQQMHKKLPINELYKWPCSGPHWCFYELPLKTADTRVLEMKVPTSILLSFDDNDWMQVANNIMNDDVATYLAYTEKEAEDNAMATEEEIKESWERMFDMSIHQRDHHYCGNIQLRAVIPYITQEMITATLF